MSLVLSLSAQRARRASVCLAVLLNASGCGRTSSDTAAAPDEAGGQGGQQSSSDIHEGDLPSAEPPLPPPPLAQHAIAAGRDFTCALRADKSVACWGTPSTDEGQVQTRTGTFRHVAAGVVAACALDQSDRAQCWGDLDIVNATPEIGLAQLSVGAVACGLTLDGRVVCWGEPSKAIERVPDGHFTDVCTSAEFACAVRDDGSIFCWGDGSHSTTTPPAGIFREIACGGLQACGLTTDGALKCWGDATDPPFDATGPFAQLATGASDYCVLDAQGGIRCDGLGRLRFASCPDDAYCGQSLPPSDAPPFSQVAVGDLHACARYFASDGRPLIRCWGYQGGGRADPPNDFKQ